MNNFLVTLTPVDKFYFGGDMTFEVKGADGHNQMYASYIIESSMFPQQTSLLGMLRFLLLRNNPELFDGTRIIKGKEDVVADLIGPASFKVINNGKDKCQFGQIEEIHRCFVRCVEHQKNQDVVHDLDFLGFDHEFSGAEQTMEKGYVNGREVFLPELTGYNAKSGYKKILSDGTFKKQLSEVFIQDRRIGIHRDIITGKTYDASLFKQISYRFNSTEELTYCFAFYLKTKDLDIEMYSGQTVSVGADNSQFVIGIESIKDIPEEPSADHGNRVVLKSPALIDDETLEKAFFAFSETIPFRFLETEVSSTQNYSIVPRRNMDKTEVPSPKRSKKYELYASGSVFYFKDEKSRTDFITGLKAYEGFIQIGYNEY